MGRGHPQPPPACRLQHAQAPLSEVPIMPTAGNPIAKPLRSPSLAASTGDGEVEREAEQDAPARLRGPRHGFAREGQLRVLLDFRST